MPLPSQTLYCTLHCTLLDDNWDDNGGKREIDPFIKYRNSTSRTKGVGTLKSTSAAGPTDDDEEGPDPAVLLWAEEQRAKREAKFRPQMTRRRQMSGTI